MGVMKQSMKLLVIATVLALGACLAQQEDSDSPVEFYETVQMLTQETAAKADGCLSSAEVAQAWVAAVNALGGANKPKFTAAFTPAKLCTALAVAHGESF